MIVTLSTAREQWGKIWRQVPLRSIQKGARPCCQRGWGPNQTLMRMWVQLWCLGVEGALWGWYTAYFGSILCQTRASGVVFGTPIMTTPPTQENNLELLRFRLIWCLCCIGHGWSWSSNAIWLNYAWPPMIINWLLSLLCAWPNGKEGQGGYIIY